MKKLFIAAFFLSVITSWFSVGRYHPDEQFQILEFVGIKKGMNERKVMPWEFHEEMRPALQVGFAYAVIEVLEKSNITDPFIWVFVLRLFSALLGLFATYKLLKYYKNKIPEKLFNVLSFLSLFYCFIPYFHVRFSSENISSSLFFIGLFGILSILENNKKYSQIFLYAIIIGFAGVARLQVNFLLIGFLLWFIFIKKENLKVLGIILLGIIFANGAGVLIDKWFYGTWEITSWNYLYNNIILHKAAEYGVQPFWYYFERIFLNGIPPFSIVIIFCFGCLFISSPRSYLTWMIIPFLLAHFLTGHKELRFLYVLIPIIPLVCIIVYDKIINSESSSKLRSFLINKKHQWFRIIFLVTNTIVLTALSFMPADSFTPTLKFIYNNYYLKPTVYICQDEHFDLYSTEVTLNFYRSKTVIRSNISLEKLKEFNLNENVKFLYICGTKDLTVPPPLKAKLVYTSVPNWLFNFNFNNWIERDGFTCIYELSQ